MTAREMQLDADRDKFLRDVDKFQNIMDQQAKGTDRLIEQLEASQVPAN